jgi:hypothetical protein
MRVLIGFLEAIGVIIAIGAWGLIPDILWDYGYKLWAMVAFVVIPIGLFDLAQRYDEWRKPRLTRIQNNSYRTQAK